MQKSKQADGKLLAALRTIFAAYEQACSDPKTKLPSYFTAALVAAALTVGAHLAGCSGASASAEVLDPSGISAAEVQKLQRENAAILRGQP